MKKYINPKMTIAMFKEENVVTDSQAVPYNNAVTAAVEELTGSGIDGKVVQAENIIKFSF